MDQQHRHSGCVLGQTTTRQGLDSLQQPPTIPGMPERAPRTRVVLPQGELRRFKLPEEQPDSTLPPRRRAVGWAFLVLVWAGLSVVCWQWVGLAWGPEQWLRAPLQGAAGESKIEQEPASIRDAPSTPKDPASGRVRVIVPADSLTL